MGQLSQIAAGDLFSAKIRAAASQERLFREYRGGRNPDYLDSFYTRQKQHGPGHDRRAKKQIFRPPLPIPAG